MGRERQAGSIVLLISKQRQCQRIRASSPMQHHPSTTDLPSDDPAEGKKSFIYDRTRR
jgi:hypothetical protein